jgi:hypothetical protein
MKDDEILENQIMMRINQSPEIISETQSGRESLRASVSATRAFAILSHHKRLAITFSIQAAKVRPMLCSESHLAVDEL